MQPSLYKLGLLTAFACSLIFTHHCKAEKSELAKWANSKIKGTPDPPLPYTTQQIFPKVPLNQPTMMMPVPGTKRMIVSQLNKGLVSFNESGTPDSIKTSLDIKEVNKDTARILAFTFAPNYPADPHCYVVYGVKQKVDDGTCISRFKVTDPSIPLIDPASEEKIIRWRSEGHQGCTVLFGPDGYLYASIGDAGVPSPPDPYNTGQDISDLLSSIIRIDVNKKEGEQNYVIPQDNPFVSLPGARGEVWAFGLRNPWRMSFHPETGELWVGDVGWELMEMIFLAKRGGNYGWSITEGSQKVRPNDPLGPTPIIPPIVEHSHVESRSITGGHFYFGKALPKLHGAYVYGDYVTGKIWALRYENHQVTSVEEIADTPHRIISFSLSREGEIDILDYNGTVHRLVKNPNQSLNTNFPKKLSETGLFQSVETLSPNWGVLPFEVNAEHWADHTTSQRVVALPDESQLHIEPKNNGGLGLVKGNVGFPQDAVLAKTIFLEMEAGNPKSKRKIETQILHRDGDHWNAYNYIWNEEQTDAILAENVASEQEFIVKDKSVSGGIRKQTWHHSSRNECLLCHAAMSGTVYSFKLPQLNKTTVDRSWMRDSSTVEQNQLDAFKQLGLFSVDLPKEIATQVSPHDQQASLEDRARAYLGLNCAHCHRQGGGGTAAFDVREELTLENTKLIDANVTQGSFGLNDPKLIASGDPYRSVLYYRLAKLGRGHMPHFGSTEIDEHGVRLLHDWITQLPDGQLATLHQNNKLRQQVQTATPAKLKAIAPELLSSTSGALLLISMLDQDKLTQEKSDLIIALGTAHDDWRIRDLFERYLPTDQRVKRLGTLIDTAKLLQLVGDATEGEQLFKNKNRVTCNTCHQVNQQGGQIGPALDEIGKKYKKAEILEHILNPSKKIDEKHQTTVIQTDTGQVHLGLLINKTSENVTLRDASGKDIIIPQAEIELMKASNTSLMPERLLQDLTAQDAANLLAYLSSLKPE